MFTFVIGGAASGKSEYAEELILKAGPMPRIYIATMEPFDSESRARIARHRALRAGKGFQTIECYTGLERVQLPGRGAVLLECIGNLTANELYSPAGAAANAGANDISGTDETDETDKATEDAVLRGVDNLLSQCRELVVVSNEVFSGGWNYEGDTFRYLRVLADINRALAGRAGRVAEIVCGRAVYYKGGELP